MKYSLAALCLLLFLFSCSPKALEYRGIQNPRIDKIALDTSVVELEVVYFNPNNFRLKLKKAALDVYADSSFIGHVSQDLSIKIPKQNQFSVPLRLAIDMRHI